MPWKPEFWSNLPQSRKQPFPHPSDATHKIWSRLANWLQRYSSLKVWTTTDDDGRRRTDDGPLVYYKLTLWAFGSGELKKLRYLLSNTLFDVCVAYSSHARILCDQPHPTHHGEDQQDYVRIYLLLYTLYELCLAYSSHARILCDQPHPTHHGEDQRDYVRIY